MQTKAGKIKRMKMRYGVVLLGFTPLNLEISVFYIFNMATLVISSHLKRETRGVIKITLIKYE
jgi:hypothetical protein